MQRGCLRAAVGDLHADEDILWRPLGVLHKDIEIAVLVERPGSEQLIFQSLSPAMPILLDQCGVRKSRLRILIEKWHVGVLGGGIELEGVLLYVFAMIALVAGQPEQSFLEDGIATIPEGKREADELMPVANAADAVFAPAIGFGSSLIMRQMLP